MPPLTMTTKIELTKEDAERFKLFMQHYDNFNKLLAGGFFNIRGASGTAHFDKDGNIRKVEAVMIKLYTVINL